jgi:membrane-bound lytic murein transglycosylase A
LYFEEKRPAEFLSDDAERISLQVALERSFAALGKKRSSGGSPDSSSERFTAESTYRTLSLFQQILLSTSSEMEMDRKVRENFKFLEVTNEKSKLFLLLTGYYEPVLEGSLEPGGEYRYPIYQRPGDLVEVSYNNEGTPGSSSPKRLVRMENGQAVPYYSRREIDTEGALREKGLELLWLKDPWERFVLHIQGSGQIRLPDGKTMRVGFAASNGRPYRSIGRYLIDQGFLSGREVTMERIREFLQQDPGRAEEIYNANERYIFFRPLPGPEGPLGALGVPLTPGRSIATDLTIFPPGALAYLISRQPVFDEDGRMAGWKPLGRFVFNQDTGAAMKGPSRVDLFFGSGEKAGRAAGEMREEGRIYFLLAK